MRLKLLILFCAAIAFYGARPVTARNSFQSSPTPLQFEIEKQTQRLSSSDVEERRDALTRLGSMRHPAASRAALPGVRDASATVRATAASAILSLPATESVGHLVSMLADKDEFVRREAAFALGRTQGQGATEALIERLKLDKKDSVRGAAAVALGELRDPTAVLPLAAIISPGIAAGSGKKLKATKDLFLLRAAARALGHIGNSAATPVLIAALQDEKTPDDVRRECAVALGLIGDPAALPILHGVETARDPYLAEEAHKAIRKIERRSKVAGGN